MTSQQSKLALASSIIQFGNANFDSYTSTTLLQTLLKGLDEAALLSYVEFLCQMIHDGSVRVASTPASTASDSDEEDESEDVRAASLAGIYAALDSLQSVAKGQALAGAEGRTPALVVALLTRLACFTSGPVSLGLVSAGQTEGARLLQLVESGSAVVEPVAEKKKGSKKIPVKAAAPVALECVSFAPELHAKAQKLLVQLLADTGHLSGGAGSGSVMDGAMTGLSVMLRGRDKYPDVSLLCATAAAAASSPDMDVDGEDEEEAGSDADAGLSEAEVEQVLVSSCDLFVAQQQAPSDAGLAKAQETLRSLLSHMLVYTLCSASGVAPAADDDEAAPNAALFVETLEQYCECVRLLMETKKSKGKGKGKVADEQSAQNPLLQLLDCCEVFLVSSDDGAGCTIRGVRAQIKRVWQAVWGAELACVSAENRTECLDSVLHMVAGTDMEDEAEESASDSESEDGSDGSDSEDEDAATMSKKLAKIAMAVGADAASDSESEEEDEEEEEDDEYSDSDSSEIGVRMKHTNLEHSEEADAALVKMIKMQQQSRKSGLAALRRQQYMARTRLLDVLEAIVHGVVSGKHGAEGAGESMLFPLLLPLLLCCRRNVHVPQTGGRKRDSSTAESRAFAARLQGLIVQKICKKAVVLPEASSMEVEEETELSFASVGALCAELRRCLVSAHAGLRDTAAAMLLSCLRSVNVSTLLPGDAKEGKAQLEEVQVALAEGAPEGTGAVPLMALTRSLFVAFVNKKSARHNLSNKLFDAFVSKSSPSLVALVLWPELVTGCRDGKDSFLRGECMRWTGGLLRRHGELAPVLRTHLLIHPTSGVGLLLANLESVAAKLADASAPTPWKRLKPLCDCSKDVCDFMHKQPASQTQAAMPTKSPKKGKTAPSAASVAPTAASMAPLVRSIICKLSEHQAQLPGVRSLVQYHNTVVISTFKLPQTAVIPVAEKPEKKVSKASEEEADEEANVEVKRKHKKHKKEHRSSE